MLGGERDGDGSPSSNISVDGRRTISRPADNVLAEVAVE
jgi:hypothetical protein